MSLPFYKTTSSSLKETEDLATLFVAYLLEHRKNKREACVVGLIGDLGSGKTAFTQAVARALGVVEHVGSPTFAIMKSYNLLGTFSMLWHIDCYRLESSQDLLALGWNNIVSNPQNLIFVEWANMVRDILPPSAILLSFSATEENNRTIIVTTAQQEQ
ncbi:MAG: tRNA (adenosine(37)-N6)-threonylcarbamoyltransferase complex ATPase subunit type 1 TsaE [bacterium]|nr:tRNA (adenosine(37)-N6)-threonylcarbamoyltransferase complex ATPase subunit type 1 TsaE [bacterium]